MLRLRVVASLFAGVLLASPCAGSEFARALMMECDSTWDVVVSSTSRTSPWRDKKTFSAAYQLLAAKQPPSQEDLQLALSALEEWLPAEGDSAAFTWRQRDLEARILWDLGRGADALEAMQAALAAYPDVSYPEPRKQDFRRVLLTRLVDWTWSARGQEVAENLLLEWAAQGHVP